MSRLLPYILIGTTLIGLAFVTVLFLYLFILGTAVGLILFTVSWIRHRFFAQKQMKLHKKQTSGITIDHQN